MRKDGGSRTVHGYKRTVRKACEHRGGHKEGGKEGGGTCRTEKGRGSREVHRQADREDWGEDQEKDGKRKYEEGGQGVRTETEDKGEGTGRRTRKEDRKEDREGELKEE